MKIRSLSLFIMCVALFGAQSAPTAARSTNGVRPAASQKANTKGAARRLSSYDGRVRELLAKLGRAA